MVFGFRVPSAILPAGYRLTDARRASEVFPGGPAGLENAQVHRYTKGTDYKQSMLNQIEVMIWPAIRIELPATEGAEGVSLELAGDESRVAYHDGWWNPVGSELGWVRGSAHSVTIQGAKGTVGVRGPRDISVSDLLKMGRSVAPNSRS